MRFSIVKMCISLKAFWKTHALYFLISSVCRKELFKPSCNLCSDLGRVWTTTLNHGAKTVLTELRDYKWLQLHYHTTNLLNPYKYRIIPTLNFHFSQVLFDGKRAMGVEVIKDGKKTTFNANKEVILSAGTVGSPKILMLSGVGPKQHLTDLKVNQIKVNLLFELFWHFRSTWSNFSGFCLLI